MTLPIKEKSTWQETRRAGGATCSALVTSHLLAATIYAAPVTLLSMKRAAPEHRFSIFVSAAGAPIAAAWASFQVARQISTLEQKTRNATIAGIVFGNLAGHSAYKWALTKDFAVQEFWLQKQTESLIDFFCDVAKKQACTPPENMVFTARWFKKQSREILAKGANRVLDKAAENVIKKCTGPLIHASIRLGAATTVGVSTSMVILLHL